MAMGLEGKVAFITGVARGQGRAHAVRLAREGCDVIGIDICQDVPWMDYPNASVADLEETAALVEKEGRRIVARQADVRDFAAVSAAVEEGFSAFGRLDIVIANAGVIRLGPEVDPLREWTETIQINLTGSWHAVRAALPYLRQGGRGGSIVITSSTAGLKGAPSPFASSQAYSASKRGLVGLMQSLAVELAPESIRVNTVHPTGVVSGMTQNAAMAAMMAQAAAGGSNMISAMQNALPVEILQPEEIANAVAWLVSDEARYLTGVQLPVDAGFSVR
ncbi:MAG TPA: mycofactocin-coupled SDR family oxidoreductase [Kineosporiaceae bacterium]